MMAQLWGVGILNAFDSDDTRGERERAARLVVAGELVAAITHDLRQPLTAIEMNVAAALRLLAHPADNARIPEAIEALRDALAEQRRMRDALQVLQDLAARREPSFGPVDIDVLVRDVVRLVSSDAAARHVRIDVECPAAVPKISADVTLLRQAVLNVLLDALVATQPPGDSTGLVTVLVRALPPSAAEVVVTHYGARGGSAASDGWGLALARSVADAHGGSLTVSGDPIGGISISMRWPVRNGAPKPEPASGESSDAVS